MFNLLFFILVNHVYYVWESILFETHEIIMSDIKSFIKVLNIVIVIINF